MPHIPPRFHVQIQPWIPVSIVWVVPGLVVSPHVHVQFQFHVAGRVGAAATAGAGDATGAPSDEPEALGGACP